METSISTIKIQIKMKQKQLFLFHHQGTTFVLTESKPRQSGYAAPNFLGQHLALAGIAKPFETLEEVTQRFKETTERNLAKVYAQESTPSKPIYKPKKGVVAGSTKPQKKAIRWAHIDESLIGTTTVI